jgi:hypothetical protein
LLLGVAGNLSGMGSDTIEGVLEEGVDHEDAALQDILC